jgi:hypothetical protein
MNVHDNAGLAEAERTQQRLIHLLRERGPFPRRLTSNERHQVFRAVRDQRSLLAFRRDGIERFLGNAGAMPDGRAVIVFPCRLLKRIGRLDFLGWGSPFGACLRVIIPLEGGPGQAALLPNDRAFEALRGGRLLVAGFRMGKLEEALEYDFSVQSDTHEALNRLLDGILEVEAEIAADPSYLPDQDLVRLNSVGEFFTKYYGRLEWLQAGWLYACRSRTEIMVGEISALRENTTAALATTPLARVPVLAQVAQVAVSSASFGERYQGIKAILRDGEKACEAIERMMGIHPVAEKEAPEALPVFSSIARIISEMELDPLLSDAGRRQLYVDSNLHRMNTWTLQPEEFPVATNQEAQDYWKWKLPGLLFDGSRYLDPGDLGISGEEILSGWEADKPTIDIRQAHDAATHLLTEATALRRWTIPPRAFVEVKAGPFIGVELTEIHDEVYFVWRASSNRYWLTSVGHRTQRFNNPLMLSPEMGGEKVVAVLEVLMAALVRDFWVAEERRKIFDVKQRQRPGAKRATGTDRHFVYLPRIRYVSSGLRFDRLNEELKHAGRARHYVRPFLRKVERPSPLQLEIARRDNVRLPEGFTYVRSHYRGGGESQAIYRSRSAISLLYDIFDPQLQATGETLASNWFDFEDGVAVLFKHLEFSVLHRAVRGKGDNGIDILAEKATGEVTEIWVVQCKFYAPKNGIGPSIVRELIGSMTDTFHDPTQAVRGMIVTTSYFTPDALRLTVKHGIQTVDGDSLNAICSAVNRTVN